MWCIKSLRFSCIQPNVPAHTMFILFSVFGTELAHTSTASYRCLPLMHVPTYRLVLHDFRPYFNSPCFFATGIVLLNFSRSNICPLNLIQAF